MTLDDREIMRLVVAGRADLFGELVRRHRPALLRAALSKMLDDTDAEDAVQETFLAAFRAKQTFDPAYSLRGWLWTILLNVCRRHRRRPVRTTSLSEVGPSIEPFTTETGLNELLAAERSAALYELLDGMSEVQADALRLRFFGELQFNEIAQAMQCSLNAAKDRVRKGLEQLAVLARRHSSLCQEGDRT